MTKEARELLILVGMPGSGKTYYCQHLLRDHARISQDEGPRRFEGIVRKLQGMLTEGVRAIVIDRTNPGREQRKTFAERATRRLEPTEWSRPSQPINEISILPRPKNVMIW